MTEIAVDTWHVLISSRMRDFEAYRQAAERAIVAAGMEPWMAEKRPPDLISIATPADLCQYMAEHCDIFVLILGPAYGFTPEGQPAGQAKSATHLEFEWAKARRPGKILVFTLQGAENTDDAAQRAFVHDVLDFSHGNVSEFFTSPAELEAQVRAALAKWRAQHVRAVPLYLEAVRDAYARQINPILAAEIDTKTTVLLQLRTEAEAREARRGWDDDQPPKSGNILGSIGRIFGREQARRPVILTQPPILDSVEGFLQKYHQIVLLGDPGAGKTTLLRRLAFTTAQNALGATGEATTDARIPIYVTAPDLGRALVGEAEMTLVGALKTITHEAGLPGATVAVEYSWQRGEALLLIDGLDEVGEADQRQAILAALRRDLGENAAILASRPAAYQDAPLAGWRVCEVQQLDDELRLRLIANVFQEIAAQQKRDVPYTALALKQQLDDRDDLRIWAGNPLLLTLMAAQYAENGTLPQERARIYRAALDRLIDAPYRMTLGLRHSIEKDRLERMLRTLALNMVQHKRNTVSEDDIAHMAALDAQPLTEAAVREVLARAAVLQQQSPGRWGFIHQTFLEYFAAAALAERPFADMQRLIVLHRFDYRWEQIAQLLVSEMDRQQIAAPNGQPAADAVVRALIAADGRWVRALGGRDLLHTSLLRATHCQQSRAPRTPPSPLDDAIDRRWHRIWRREVFRKWLQNGSLMASTKAVYQTNLVEECAGNAMQRTFEDENEAAAKIHERFFLSSLMWVIGLTPFLVLGLLIFGVIVTNIPLFPVSIIAGVVLIRLVSFALIYEKTKLKGVKAAIEHSSLKRLPVLIQDIQNCNLHDSALVALHKMGSVAAPAVPLLIKLANGNPDRAQRFAVIDALWDMRTLVPDIQSIINIAIPDMVAALVEKQTDYGVRSATKELFVKLGTAASAAIPLLEVAKNKAKRPDPLSYYYVNDTLKQLLDEDGDLKLLRYLREARVSAASSARSATLEKIDKISDPKSASLLLHILLYDLDESVRAAAAAALEKISPPAGLVQRTLLKAARDHTGHAFLFFLRVLLGISDWPVLLILLAFQFIVDVPTQTVVQAIHVAPEQTAAVINIMKHWSAWWVALLVIVAYIAVHAGLRMLRIEIERRRFVMRDAAMRALVPYIETIEEA
jgi:HEAT repeat protein